MWKTNPIPERIVRNEPNFPVDGTAAVGSLPASRPSGIGPPSVGCTNKPNSCHYADPEIGVPGRANRAKQTQFLDCGLWIADSGRTCGGTPAPLPCCLGPVRANSAKRSQFSAGRPGSRRQKCAKRTQFGPAGWGKAPGRRKMRNKPNLPSAAQGPRGSRARTPNPRRADLCKTNPISAVAAVESPIIPIFHYSSVPARCLLCKTNPISLRGTGIFGSSWDLRLAIYSLQSGVRPSQASGMVNGES